MKRRVLFLIFTLSLIAGKMAGQDCTISGPAASTSICVGGVVNLSVIAGGGTASYSYVWQYSADGSTGWGSVSNGVPSGITYGGGSTANLTITGDGTEVTGNGYYNCIVTATTGCGPTTSTVATVTIVADIVISADPLTPSPVCVGGTLSALTVTASNGTPSLTYQWYSNTTNSTSGGTLLTGETANSYTPPTTSAGTLYYYCIVSASGSGCGSMTSATATVTIAADIVISADPLTPSPVCVGGSLSALTVTASNGTPSLTYQWYSNTTNSTSSGTLLTGETANSYTPPTTSAGTLYYYCIVSASGSGCGSATSATATVTVDPVSVGGTVSISQTICNLTSPLDLVLSGNTGTVVKWQKSSDSGFTSPSDISVTSTTLTGATIGILITDTYFRAVVKSGACSEAFSSSVTVTVRPTPTASISVTNSTVCKNASSPVPVITFTNTQALPVRIIYSINGINQTPIDVTSTATLNAPTNIAGIFNYTLVSVAYQAAPVCSSLITGTATVTIDPLPLPTITGPATPRITSTGNVYTTELSKDNYLWTFSAGGTKTGGGGSLSNTITITWGTEGAQWVKVNYDNNPSGCSATNATQYDVNVKSLPLASNVIITGTPEVGKLLAASYTYSDGAGYDEGASICKWYRSGLGTPVGTGKTYTPDTDDEGETITFKVTPVSLSPAPNEGDPLLSTPTSTVVSSGVPVASEVCINGIRRVGEILTGKYKYTFLPKAEGTSKFRWLRDGLEVGDQLTYTLTALDTVDARSITFEVTPKSLPSVKTGLPVESYPLARFNMTLDTYSESIDSVTLAADPMGGVFSGTGVTNGIFSPNAVGYTNSPYTLHYQVNIVNTSNTCSQQASKMFTVTKAGTYFNIDNDTVICHDSDPFTIKVKGIPPGAVPYYGYGFFFNWDPYFYYDSYMDTTYYFYSDGQTDPKIVSQELSGAVPYIDDATTPWAVTIDPRQLSPGSGNNILYLYYYYNYYYYLVQVPLNVESNVIVNRINNLNGKYCADDPVQDLSVDVLYPIGSQALWTGGAILSDLDKPVAKLNPASGTPAGSPYTITYQYKSPKGCLSNILSQEVTVNPLPDPAFTLNPYYNIDSGAVTLIPLLPPGGSFVGNGVSANKLFPDLAGTGSDIITYSIKDANLCYNELTKTTIIRKAQGTIVGLPPVVCYRDTTYNVSVTGLPSGASVLDFTNAKNTIVHSPGASNADYNILAAGAGLDTLFFSYRWDAVDYAISTIVNVDSIGQVVIKNLLPNDIVCANLEPFELFTTPSGGVFTGPVSGGYLDPSKAMGSTSVSYKYTNIKTGCSATTVVPFKISPAPNVSFAPVDVCIENSSDTTFFINNTVSSDSVTSWQWEFTDPGGSITSYEKSPGYLYKTGSFHTVSLTATTVNNCISSKISTIDLGVRPVADFYWKNECFNVKDSIMLFDTTFSTSPIVSQSWNFFDGGQLFTGKKTKYPKKATGYLPVRYIVNTSYANCADTLSKNIYIPPTISLAADDYFENFEAGNGDWVKGDESVNSWYFGKPDRNVINTAASGNNAWFTSYDLANQKVESSSVVSPCFDFSTSKRPMIRLKLWRRFEMNRDGAALQYKIGDIGTWQYVGSVDDGINWYNSTLIKGRPGGEQIGWTTIGTPDVKWIESRHNLDAVKGMKNVKFRISYGSDATSTNNDGIAFDDILIGERSRNVLLEHFTNTFSETGSEATAMVNEIALANSEDIINIQYHTNFPGIDSFYLDNPGDASARILFYGLTKVPYSFIDGGTGIGGYADIFNFANKESDGTLSKISSNDVTRRSLINPKFSINIDPLSVTGGILSVGTKLKALEDISSDNLTLYLAVTEKLNTDYTGANGETNFYNIFRKFIPNAGGINLKQAWAKGDVVSIPEETWVIEKTLNKADIEVIAFVQNSVTKELFQAVSVLKPDITVGIESPGRSNGHDFALYPNPAVNKLTIAFKEPLVHDTDIRIYDVRGVVVASYKAESGLSEFTIDGLGLRGGIYLVRISSGTIDLGFKKLIISSD